MLNSNHQGLLGYQGEKKRRVDEMRGLLLLLNYCLSLAISTLLYTESVNTTSQIIPRFNVPNISRSTALSHTKSLQASASGRCFCLSQYLHRHISSGSFWSLKSRPVSKFWWALWCFTFRSDPLGVLRYTTTDSQRFRNVISNISENSWLFW